MVAAAAPAAKSPALHPDAAASRSVPAAPAHPEAGRARSGHSAPTALSLVIAGLLWDSRDRPPGTRDGRAVEEDP